MMNDANTPIGQPAAVNPPGKLAYATPTTAPLVAGRRAFFKYRDLGVGREQREDARPGDDRGRWDDAADGVALARLRSAVRLHAQWLG